jgi:hypothetical protein
MKEIKEIFESIGSRIRSPYFGFFVLFSIGLNWKAWLLLILDKLPISERITSLDERAQLTCIAVC